jgi:hypothetical protein
MRTVRRAWIATFFLAISAGATAGRESVRCFSPDVELHVRQQFAHYGPLSEQREYFGLIYRQADSVRSAVTRSARCASYLCQVNVAKAARAIPADARVLGEWHTHPHDGSTQLSEYDVRGAHLNNRASCYAAFYSKPDGGIFGWDAHMDSISTAMSSLLQIGNYRRDRIVTEDTGIYVAHGAVSKSAGAPTPGAAG